MCHENFFPNTPATIIKKLILRILRCYMAKHPEKITLLVVAVSSHYQLLRSGGGSIKPLLHYWRGRPLQWDGDGELFVERLSIVTSLSITTSLSHFWCKGQLFYNDCVKKLYFNKVSTGRSLCEYSAVFMRMEKSLHSCKLQQERSEGFFFHIDLGYKLFGVSERQGWW